METQTMTSTLMDSKTSLCRTCGTEIEYTPILIHGMDSGIYPNICVDCEMKENEEQEKHEAEDRAARWLEICPADYRITNPNHRDMPAEKLKKVMNWKYGPKGLVLHGMTRKCKSRCAYLLLKRLHQEGHTIAAYDSTDFVNQASDKFYNGTGGAWVESIIRASVFFLDDLGNEPSGDRGAGEIWHIIKRRCEELLPVIITTNSIGEELSGKLKGPRDRGLALVERLREYCEPIAF
jgi:DNA replication protein DnaC